ASEGALITNSDTNSTAHAPDRRWSATELVTPLRMSRLGKEAVPSARQRNNVTKSNLPIAPNGCTSGFVLACGALPGSADANGPGSAADRPRVGSSICHEVR